MTVTFHAAKVGLWVDPGKGHAGRVEVVADRHSAGAVGRAGRAEQRPDPPGACIGALPARGPASTKFSSGSRAGGRRRRTGLTGAVCMACEGAMRAGAGLGARSGARVAQRRSSR